MDGTLQIIVGILAIFFLGVAIAKSLAQRARRREAAAKSLAASQSAQEVSLHNPFSAESEAPQADGGVAGVDGGDAGGNEYAGSQVLQGGAPAQPAEASEEPSNAAVAPGESIYKWE